MREEDVDVMDAVLHETLAAPAPRLSPAFDAKVMTRVRSARLTSSGRMVMAFYAIAALTIGGWLMQDVPVQWMAASVALGVPAAAVLAGYARNLAKA